MNKSLRIVCIAILIVLSASTLGAAQPAAPGGGTSPAASVPWKAKIVLANVDTSQVSAYFVGNQHYPLIAYTTDNGSVKYLMPGIGEPGDDCGAANAWHCGSLPGEITTGKTSHIAVYPFNNSFKIGVAYQPSGSWAIRVNAKEFSDDLDYLTYSNTDIVDLGIYAEEGGILPWHLLGPPSLIFDDSGNPHIAFILRYHSGGPDRLIYAHKTNGGVAPTTPCNPTDPGNLFQCDMIYEDSHRLSAFVSIVLNQSGDPRISYISFEDNSLRYAYPQTSALLHPNCGPGGNTWRCVTIEQSSTDVDFIGSTYLGPIEMAIGPNSPQFIYKATASDLNTYIRYAKFVSSGGNCGQDYALTSINPITYTLVYRWLCTSILWDTNNYPPYSSFSLKVDALDYPVIAFNYRNGTYYHLWLFYPAERSGGTPGAWHSTKIDGKDANTGYAAGLALTENGLGLIGYIELLEYEPTLKMAYQDGFKTYLPSVRH